MDYRADQNCFPMGLLDTPNHECNIKFYETFSLDDKKSKTAREQAEFWKRHKKRLENLSRPKRKMSRTKVIRDEHGVPLSKLLPRICTLSQPRYVTPKYVKPVEEPFELPGCVKDWESHKKWLEIRAQPRNLKKRLEHDEDQFKFEIY